ncbi:hypothetical protein NDN08_000974 [Rhodosorus marinus]|uniref:Exoribonuclease phosphorolytic domain-containing protein n=1 Tax=Rhodosorus marinus TaxID=101924 RepID=A0AAV8UT46_9RHOD|nr:hypothetical protein NDN08_000974 [Rhodosorus marinus]
MKLDYLVFAWAATVLVEKANPRAQRSHSDASFTNLSDVDLTSMKDSVDLGDGADGLREYEQKRAAGRRDGREASELRALKVEQDFLEQCDGSSRLACGGTVVMAAVYGPIECPLKAQLSDRAIVRVDVKGASSTVSRSSKWLEKYFRESFEPVIATGMFPRSAIVIALQVMQDDGSVLATGINAGMMALVDAVVPLRSIVCASSVAMNSNHTLVLDPTQAEQGEAVVHATFAFESGGGLVSCKTWGFFEDERSFSNAASIAEQAAGKVQAFLQIASNRKVNESHSI